MQKPSVKKTSVPSIKIVASNRKALFNYEVIYKLEAGMVLLGTEVKSIREGKCSIDESYIDNVQGDLELINSHINPYNFAKSNNHDPNRHRKLLLNKAEIIKLKDGIAKKGYTAIPLKMYFKSGKVKLEIALGKGKNLVDKRQTIKERDWKREQGKILKDYKVKH